MTHVSDNLWLGGAPTQIDSTISDGGLGFGPIGRIYVYDQTPLALNTSAYAASQSPATAALTLRAGTGITAVVDPYGVTRYTADVPRTVTITSGGNDTGITFLVKGYDQYNYAMSEAITGANATIATGKKAFKSVVSITPSGSVATTVIAGTSDVFGLPCVLADIDYIINAKWDATLAANAGTAVAADATSPATTTTGDVRGTFAQSGNASNGSRRLVITLALSKNVIGLEQTVTNVLGVTQA